MRAVLIGSQAMNHHFPGWRPQPADVDLLMSYEDFTKEWLPKQENVKAVYPIEEGRKFVVRRADQLIREIELAKPGNSAQMLIDLLADAPKTADGYLLPDPNLLFTIKASHRFRKNSVFFDKTMADYHRMRGMGMRLVHPEFYKLREQETYTYSHPKLNQSKKSFFADDGIKYVYDHDTLHLAVKQDEKPAYSYFKPPEKDVMVSRKMFDALPHRTKLNSVLEEAYVLALERSQIPFGEQITPKGSFDIALMKVCTSITSGWWRAFAYDHYYEVLALYSDAYVERLKDGLRQGIVKPHVG